MVAEGGIVTGARVPPLDKATPRQIREAVRIGPYVMPRFSKKAISDRELEDIVAYVQYAQNPHDAGGWSINHLGPFPEGLAAWFIAIGVLLVTCIVIGTRVKKG
jgi:ubiquinol-cytochrome c reductase cytochrome c subunit